MKIISKFKDYYDYYAKVYGRDDALVYKRGISQFDVTIGDPSSSLVQKLVRGVHSEPGNQYVLIVGVCGRFFPLTTVDHGQITPEPKDYSIVLVDKPATKWSTWNYERINTGDVYAPLLEYQKRLKEPVIGLSGYSYSGWYPNNLQLMDKVPILKEYGIDKLLTAEQCYQEIYQFLSVLNNKEVLTNMTDRDKIESHGFDLKQSFRHRN